MKKKISKLILLSFVLCIFCFSINVEAKTDKMTMFIGDSASYSYSGIGKLKKVTSSNKNIISVKKKGKYCYIKAKKKGKATITIKGKKGKYKHSITVKETNFNVSVTKIDDYYAHVVLNNNTTESFESFKISIEFKDSDGKTLGKKESYMSYVGKNQIADDMVPLNNYGAKVDFSKTVYKVTYTRDPGKKYYNYASKVKFSDSSKKTNAGNLKVTSNASISINSKQDISIAYDFIGYDANGNVYSVIRKSNILNKKNKIGKIEVDFEPQVVSYKINKRVMLIK